MLPIDSSALLFNTPSLSTGAKAPVVNSAGSEVKDTFLDQNALNSVKAMGRKNDPQALKEIAKKFEGMFVQQMLKSMREANAVFAEDSMTSSNEEKFHQDMLDQQMVLNLTSGKGIGLAASMFQQMQKMHGKAAADVTPETPIDAAPLWMPSTKTQAQPDAPQPTAQVISNPKAVAAAALLSREAIKPTARKNGEQQSAEEFIASLMPFAEKAAAELNVNTDVILAQAALETGWGKHMLRDGQGNSSFNLFNIKKNSSWEGKSIGVNSLEYKQGIAQMENSEFRQYEGYNSSFADYVELLKGSPRYQRVLDAGNDSSRYAEALQKAGYATDPDYAEKIKNLLNSDAIRSAVDGKTSTAKAVDSTRG